MLEERRLNVGHFFVLVAFQVSINAYLFILEIMMILPNKVVKLQNVLLFSIPLYINNMDSAVI